MGRNAGVDKVMNIVMVWKRKEKASSPGWKIKRTWEQGSGWSVPTSHGI